MFCVSRPAFVFVFSDGSKNISLFVFNKSGNRHNNPVFVVKKDLQGEDMALLLLCIPVGGGVR